VVFVEIYCMRLLTVLNVSTELRSRLSYRCYIELLHLVNTKPIIIMSSGGTLPNNIFAKVSNFFWRATVAAGDTSGLSMFRKFHVTGNSVGNCGSRLDPHCVGRHWRISFVSA